MTQGSAAALPSIDLTFSFHSRGRPSPRRWLALYEARVTINVVHSRVSGQQGSGMHGSGSGHRRLPRRFRVVHTFEQLLLLNGFVSKYVR